MALSSQNMRFCHIPLVPVTFFSPRWEHPLNLHPKPNSEPNMKTVVPIFFSVNDAYSPFLATAIASIKDNASRECQYHIHVLTDDISEENALRLHQFADEHFQIEICHLTERIQAIPAVKKLQNHCFRLQSLCHPQQS